MADHNQAESEAPIGVDEGRGIELFRSPQRPADAVGPEQHISMAGAELHGHPDSCCCHAACDSPACRVPNSPANSTGGAIVTKPEERLLIDLFGKPEGLSADEALRRMRMSSPPANCGCPTSGLGYRHHRQPCSRAGENEPINRPGVAAGDDQ